MKFTKLFRPSTVSNGSNACAQIHADHYSCHLSHILKMVAVLKKDFPGIKDGDIQVQKYAGRRVKGVTFVEVFFKKHTDMPKGYEEVKDIEYVL